MNFKYLLVRNFLLGLSFLLDKFPSLVGGISSFISKNHNAFIKKRSKVAKINISRCFPCMSGSEVDELVSNNIYETIYGYLSAIRYWRSDLSDIKKNSRIVGFDSIIEAQNRGKGVVLMGGHFTPLDLGGIASAFKIPVSVSYRPHNDAAFDLLINKGRYRWAESLVDAKNIKRMVKGLRQGELLWYAPDQDFGREGSMFCPFFGINAATTLGISKIAKLGKAIIVPISFYIDRIAEEIVVIAHNSIDAEKHTDEDILMIYNNFLEKEIKKNPEQYMWVHRRFKTNPLGGNDFYGVLGKR